MDAAKIRLSPKEMDLVLNADWILTKNRVMEKARGLLEELQAKLLEYNREHKIVLNTDISTVPPKISKGENYRGLPYLVLDYPRLFNKGDVFAIRIMFWWGNFFSVTLQLGGIYKEKAKEKIANAFPLLGENNFFYCINEDEWEHHFEEDNYISLQGISAESFDRQLEERAFIKIAKKTQLQQWDTATIELFEQFKIILKILLAY